MTTKRYLALALFALAFGVEEAIIVVYLRQLSFVHQTYALEVGREACTLFVIAAIAWLAGSTAEQRAKAFCFAFGAWDIIYYLGLWQLSGSPTLTDPDILFLIPVPWVAPVWAAVAFAVALMLIGVVGVPRERSALLTAGFVLGWISFVYQAAFGARAYPFWLFLPAYVLVLAAVLGPLGRERQKLDPSEVRGGSLE